MESRLEVRDNVLKEAGPIVIAHNAGDGVVAATYTWTFVNATFTVADEGHALVVAGAANPGNNGTFIIQNVVDATNITTYPKGVLVNEAFGAGVTQQISIDPCWAIQSGATQIQITYADGTIVQANGADAKALLDNIKSFIKQAEMRGVTTGGPFKWTFAAKGTVCNQVPEDQP